MHSYKEDRLNFLIINLKLKILHRLARYDVYSNGLVKIRNFSILSKWYTEEALKPVLTPDINNLHVAIYLPRTYENYKKRRQQNDENDIRTRAGLHNCIVCRRWC